MQSYSLKTSSTVSMYRIRHQFPQLIQATELKRIGKYPCTCNERRRERQLATWPRLHAANMEVFSGFTLQDRSHHQSTFQPVTTLSINVQDYFQPFTNTRTPHQIGFIRQRQLHRTACKPQQCSRYRKLKPLNTLLLKHKTEQILKSQIQHFGVKAMVT